MISNVLEYEGNIYIRFRGKKNKLCVHRVDSIARALVLEYASRYSEFPAPYFFHNQNNPNGSMSETPPIQKKMERRKEY